MLNNGDKIISIRDNGSVIKSGDVFYVTEITDDGVVFYKSEDDKQHGCVSENMFDKYFKVEEKPKAEEDHIKFKNKITGSDVDNIISKSKIMSTTAFDKCTIVACQLPNGFVVVETSSCVDPANYDEELGFNACMNRIKDKVWELEGYLLQSNLHMYDMLVNGLHEEEDGCDSDDQFCDGDCFNCPEFDDDEHDDKEDDCGDYDYWDHVVNAYEDFLDWVDDYFDDMAERDKHYRR